MYTLYTCVFYLDGLTSPQCDPNLTKLILASHFRHGVDGILRKMAFVLTSGGSFLGSSLHPSSPSQKCAQWKRTPCVRASAFDVSSELVREDVTMQPLARGPQRKKPPAPVPMVSFGDNQMDVYSRLAKDRILLLGRAVDDEVANALVAQMLFLNAEDPDKDITLYINSPGGGVSAGMAIFDTMNFIKCDVQTICFGTAASMGAFLLGAGTKGKRKSLPNARIMIHQPLGGAQGQAADIEIQAREILFVKRLLNGYMSDQTGQPLEKIETDTDRDFFMTAADAKEYGIIDSVIETKLSVPVLQRPALF